MGVVEKSATPNLVEKMEMDDNRKLVIQGKMIEDLTKQIELLNQKLEYEKERVNFLEASKNELFETIESLKNVFVYKTKRIEQIISEYEKNNDLLKNLT